MNSYVIAMLKSKFHYFDTAKVSESKQEDNRAIWDVGKKAARTARADNNTLRSMTLVHNMQGCCPRSQEPLEDNTGLGLEISLPRNAATSTVHPENCDNGSVLSYCQYKILVASLYQNIR